MAPPQVKICLRGIEGILMSNITRRRFIELAASFGAALAWRSNWSELCLKVRSLSFSDDVSWEGFREAGEEHYDI